MGGLVWAAIGFGAAAFGAEYFLPESGLPYTAAALAALSLLSLLLRGKKRAGALIVLLSAAAGLLLWWARYEIHVAPCEALVGEELTVTAEVTERPARSDGYDSVAVRITDGAPRERARLYLFRDSLPELTPGDIIETRIRVSSAVTRDGVRVHTYLSAGISMMGHIRSVERVGQSGHAFLYFPQRIAEAVREQCAALFSGEDAAFMTALLTGDKDGLYADTALYGDMRAAGVLHIVAVSGMHLFILVSFLQLAFGRGKRTSLLCLPVIVVFVLMTGAGASIVRAAVMQILLLLAPIFGREYDGASSLSAALLALLLPNPMAIGGVALQLSFACVLGFVVFMPRLSAWMNERMPMHRFLVRHAAQSVACTLCALTFSLPLSAYYFGSIALFAVFSNLLTLPVVEVLFSGGYIVCIAASLVPAAGMAGAWVLSRGVRWCALVYRLIASIPFSCLYTVDPGAVIWLAGVYAMAAAWLILRRRGVRVTALIPAELCLIGLLVVLLTDGLALRPGDGEIDVLNVGQGECVLLLNDTSAVMFDCGGSGTQNAGDAAAARLRAAGKTRVDALILSHLHEDHVNGVVTLLERMPVSLLIYPAGTEDEDDMLGEILAAAARRDTAVLALENECVARFGTMALTLLLPRAGEDENERGIVALAEFPAASALLMGDAGQSAELALLTRGLVPDVDVLVVGHHGSKTASGVLFLSTARPETAVVSVGRNIYGLPADEVMERLWESCPEVLRTDEAGTVTIQMRAEDTIYG